MEIGVWLCLIFLLPLTAADNQASQANQTSDTLTLDEKTNLKAMINTLCTEADKAFDQHKEVAFTVVLEKSITLGSEQVVPYEKVLTNIGNGYDTECHHFIVPVEGVYSVSVSMMGDPNNGIHLQLVKDGNELVRLWTGGGNSYELASHTINVFLKKGERVWVQRRATTGSDLYGSEPYNVFSGVLITR